MSESSQRGSLLSSANRGTVVPQKEQLNKFGTVVLALWPQKPAVILAQVAGCSERHANLLIRGERKPNARITLAVMGEIIE